jgi:hypothetical protein
VTYLIHGEIEHGDSLGNKGEIKDGDCQWMTAGSGILHQEMPKAQPQMLGVQVWLNLAKKDKMTDPKYRDITSEMVPVYEEESFKIHIVAGTYGDVTGPMEAIETKPSFFDVELKANSEFLYEIDPDFNSYAFLVRGEAVFDNDKGGLISYPNGVLFDNGDTIRVTTKDKPARFLLLSGKKLNEPVAWGGPIVMNTKEELQLAFQELNQGTFIKKK